MIIDPKLDSTEAFKAIVESSLDVITIVSEQGDIAYQSPSIEMFGFKQGDLAGQRVLDRVHPDDRERIGLVLQDILAPTDKVERQELRILHQDGSWRHVEVVARHFEQGDFRGALLNTRDITAKYEMLKYLERSNTLFSTIFSVSRNILSISSTDTGVFLDVNNQWLATFGYEREEVIGKSSIELNVWGSKENRDKVVSDLQREGRLQNYETWVVTKSGESRNLILDATFIDVLDEQRLLFSATDVTDRMIIEDQLRQSQKMEAIGQLTGGVAHDFNNLLSIITGNAELIAEYAKNNSAINELIDAILKASDRGSALTQQLLAFSRRQALSPRTVYLDKLVVEMQPILQRALGANIHVDIENSKELWPCFADPSQIENAVLNIALNARDAMPGGGTLTISTMNRVVEGDSINPAPGNYVQITFLDDGTGIPSEVLDQVFEPFFTTKETGKGTGLGLSMVFGFVKQSGGHILLDSEQEKGTQITILLPKSESAENLEGDASSQLSIGMGERILLLEDNAELRQVTTRNLEQLGYKVKTASSEEELDTLIAKEPFDLLITDVMLPGEHKGPEIAARLQRQFPSLKVLLVSGYARGVMEDDIGDETSVRLLTKPFTRGQLASAVREALNGQLRT